MKSKLYCCVLAVTTLLTACNGGTGGGGGSGTFYDATAALMPTEAWTTQDPAVGDVDGDGDMDVVLPGFFATQDRLLRNTGGRLVDDTAASLPVDTSDDVHAELGDVDGDGDLDLYMAAEGPDRLLINNGAGRYSDESAARLSADNDNSEDADFGDIDGDGDLDIVIANLGAGEPNRLLINYRGRFMDESAARLPQQAEPSYTAKFIDVNGNGSLDIVIGNYGAPSRVMLNDGQGRYTEVSDAIPGPSGYTTALTPGDVDGDGDPDLYEARFIGADRLLLNDGTGRYSDASTRIPQDTTSSYDAQFADLDGDKDLDVAVARSGAANAVLINDGGGQYTPRAGFPGDDDRSYGVGVGDFNNDGGLDLIYTSWAGDQTLLYLNGTTDTTTFRVTRVNAVQGPTSGGTPFNIRGYGLTADAVVTVGGQPLQGVTLVGATWLRGVLPPGAAGAVDVTVTLGGATTTLPGAFTYVNPPEGTLYADVTATHLPADFGPYTEVLLVDVNQDTHLDMVLSRQAGGDRLFLGTGDGHYNDGSVGLPFSGEESNSVGAVDIDKDGDLDLVFARKQGVRLFINNGGGVYTAQAWAGDFLDEAQAVAFGDFNGDASPDVLVGRDSRPDTVLLSGGGTHTSQALPITPGSTLDVRVADVNGDARLDLLLVRVGMLDVLLLGDGAGGFQDASTRLPDDPSFISFSADMGDIDSDGDIDILVAVGGATGLNRLWRNDGSGQFVDVTASQWPAALYGTAESLLVDLDGDGDLDVLQVNFFGPDQLYRNDGAGNFQLWGSLPEATDLRALSGAVGDVDHDGDLDIALAVLFDIPRLFLAR